MSTISKVRGDVFRKLRQPSERSLGDGAFIDDAAIEVSDELTTEVNQTREPWFVMDLVLEVESGRDEYPIDAKAPSFGKGRYAYTIDDTDPTHSRRAVDIVSPEYLTEYYGAGLPSSVEVPNNIKHTARAISFIYKVGTGNIALVAPTPGLSASYKVQYEPDVMRPDAPQASVTRFRQFDYYVSDLIALRCLPLAEWDEFLKVSDPIARDAANRARRQELAQFLTAQIAKGADQFRRFKWSTVNRNDVSAIGFGQNRW
jgi:hypothetical protein